MTRHTTPGSGIEKMITMAGFRSLRTLAIIVCVLFQIVYSNADDSLPHGTLQDLVSNAIDELHARSPSQYNYEDWNLVDVQKSIQPDSVVYELTINMNRVCDEGLTDCPTEFCTLYLNDRSGNIGVDEITCDSSSRGKRSLRAKRDEEEVTGGESAISTDDEDIKMYANQGVQKLAETFEGPNDPIIGEILSATQQVVAGSLYRIQLTVVASTCAKGVKENCEPLADSASWKCEVRAWSRPWLSESADIQITCDDSV